MRDPPQIFEGGHEPPMTPLNPSLCPLFPTRDELVSGTILDNPANNIALEIDCTSMHNSNKFWGHEPMEAMISHTDIRYV